MAGRKTDPVHLGERRSDETLREIVGLIFEGHLSPGSRLPSERELSEHLGVSRSTLRDAMNRLEARGFIERRSKSGNYIRTAIPRSLREPIEEIVRGEAAGLREMIELRMVLELWAVRKAAGHPDRKALALLKDCLRTMKSNAALQTGRQLSRYGDADLKFHQILAGMTGNSIYIHLFHFLARLVSRSIATSRRIMPDDFGAQNLRRHERILRAVQKGDIQEAEEALLDHFRYVENHLPGRKETR